MITDNDYLPGLNLTSDQSERVNKYFPRAIKAGYFKRRSEGGYQWAPEFARNSKFAYFINETLNPNGRYKLRRAELERLFGLTFGGNVKGKIAKEMQVMIFYD